jgi:hypothetical protein
MITQLFDRELVVCVSMWATYKRFHAFDDLRQVLHLFRNATPFQQLFDLFFTRTAPLSSNFTPRQPSALLGNHLQNLNKYSPSTNVHKTSPTI